MPFCGRKFNGSGYIGSRWSSFLDLSHGRNIRLPPHTRTHNLKHAHPFKFAHQIYSAIERREIEQRSVYLPRTSGTMGSYFSVQSSVFSLSLSLLRVCVPPSSLFFFLTACFPAFSVSSAHKSCRLTNLMACWRKALLCVCVWRRARVVICLRLSACACVGGCV